MTRKLTAVLAVFCLLATLWAPLAVTSVSAEAPASFYFGRSILEQMDNSAALCYAYDKLTEGLENKAESIDISHRTHTISTEEAQTVIHLLEADRPDFYWIKQLSYSYIDDTVISFAVTYDEVALAYIPAVEQRAEQLTEGLEKKSDYEKSVALHDRLCDAVVYEFSDHNQTVIGSLVLGASVCAGYARAYQMLLQELGVPCFYVTGYSRDQSHAWNLVQLDGEWYYTDVTWDDQNDNGGDIYYTYLNVTYAQIAEDHTEEELYVPYLPHSTATKHNYYEQNGLLLDITKPIDVKAIAKAIKENYPPQFYIVGGTVTEAIAKIQPELPKIIKEIMGKSYAASCSIGSLSEHDMTIYLEIQHPHSYQTETVDPSCLIPGTKTQSCKDCGYTVKEEIPATGHDFSGSWQDDTHHGKACTKCGLTEEGEEHIYDDDKDADCNKCGYEREVATTNYGDTNGDGKINNRDLGLLQQYLNDWNVTIDLAACDVNNDGKLNNRDLGLLQQYLNDWNVTLG